VLLHHLQIGVQENATVTLWSVRMHEASTIKKFLSCVRKFQTSLWYIVIVPWVLSYCVGCVSVQRHSTAIRFTSPVPQNGHNAGNPGQFTLLCIISHIKHTSSQEGAEHEVSFSKLISQKVAVWETELSFNVPKSWIQGMMTRVRVEVKQD